MQNHLLTPLTLPCGVTLPNRLVKAAMTERMSDAQLAPTSEHAQLYANWAHSGAGLLITGNVIIDRTHLESGGNVSFDGAANMPMLEKWAAAAQQNGTACWVQLSHAGRQTNRFNTSRPLAPSAVPLKKMGLFGRPRAMTQGEIEQVISGFVRAATLAKNAGFGGVQIHAAHGYLLNQFLSPRTNLRTDQWGGSLENRSRLLLQIVREVRTAVGASFPISVKLNSSDFQRGGFSEDESLQVIRQLEEARIDLLEISGGTYEKLAFFMLNEQHKPQKASTIAREAYFLDFAQKVRAFTRLPLMVTGGFRSFEFCNQVLANGELDLIGMGRPFLTNLPEIPQFLNGELPILQNLILRTGVAAFDDAAEGGFYARQLIRLAQGKPFEPHLNPIACSLFLVWHEWKKGIMRK